MLSFARFSTAIALTLGVNVAIADNAHATTATAHLTSSGNPLQIAQEPPARPPRKRDSQTDNMIQSLNLSEAQKKQLAAIREKYKGQMNQLRNSVKTNQQELEALLDKNAPDREIRDKHKQLEQNRQALSNLLFDSMMETRQVLTPAQRSQLSQMRQDRRNRYQDRTNGEGGQ